MFEIFLFVNPIGIYCYDTEVSVKNALSELNIKSKFRFIPITNAKVIREDIIRRKMQGQTINDIPQYTMASFQALRTYHAINLKYGNRKARYYLVNLQKEISGDFNVYSQDLPQQVALNLDLDLNKINDPSINHYIDFSIKKDRETARNYNVRNIPTAIIYNETGNSTTGLLIEGLLAHDKLVKLFKNEEDRAEKKDQEYLPSKHLRLM